MKKIIIISLVFLLIFSLISCGASSNKVLTAEEIISAFQNAGYETQSHSYSELLGSDADDMFSSEGAPSEVKLYTFSRMWPGIDEGPIETGYLIYYKFSNEEQAINDFYGYKTSVEYSENRYIVKSNEGFEKVYFVENNDYRSYGITDYYVRVYNTIIHMHVDWDNFQDAEMEYDHLPQKTLESLGY